MSDSHIVVYCTWKSFMADPELYKPNSPVFEPQEVSVAVEVPAKYVYGRNGTETILTPAGVRYVMQKVREVFEPKQVGSEYADEDFE